MPHEYEHKTRTASENDRLNEREAWYRDMAEVRNYWDEAAITFTTEADGDKYHIGVYSLRDETNIEVACFGETDDGIEFIPCPLSRSGLAFHMVKYRFESVEQIKAYMIVWIAEQIVERAPIRAAQKRGYATTEEVHAAVWRHIRNWSCWKKLQNQPMDDDTLRMYLKRFWGIGGSGSSLSLCVEYCESQFKFWAYWDSKFHDNTRPNIKGEATIKLVRELINTHFGIYNPSDQQMTLL